MGVQIGRPLLGVYLKELPSEGRLLLAGDHTAWPRPSAFTLEDRTVEHPPTKVPGNRPITVGQGYATLAWVSEETGSWALPLLHERISSVESPLEKAAGQLQAVCQGLSTRPLTLWDSEYGGASFVLQTADIPADKLFRLRPNRCLWGPPPPYSGKGRPRIHGDKFKLSDPATWPEPVAPLEKDDPKLGRVRLQQGPALHFRKAPDHPMGWCGSSGWMPAAPVGIPRCCGWRGGESLLLRWRRGGGRSCAGVRWIPGIALPSSASAGPFPE